MRNLLNLIEFHQDATRSKHLGPSGQCSGLQLHTILRLNYAHSYTRREIQQIRSWPIEVLNDMECGK